MNERMSDTPNYYRHGDSLDKLIPFLCPVCGGINDARQYSLFRLSIYPAILYPIGPCDCDPTEAATHDGKLDALPDHDEHHATVEIQEDYGLHDGSRLIEIAGGRGDCEHRLILLEPMQAIALSDWLQQNKEELMRMAKDNTSE